MIRVWNRAGQVILTGAILCAAPLEAQAQIGAVIPVPPGQGKLIPQSAVLGDQFATTLDMSGNVLVAGGLAAAWIFERDLGGWTETARLTAPNATPNFGCCVATDGVRVVVGDTGDSSGGINARVFVFEKIAGEWVINATLPNIAGASPFDEFGSALDVDADRIAVGAKHVGGDVGAAFLYEFNGVAWTEELATLAPSPSPGGLFGTAVGVSGDRLVIGAPGHPTDQVYFYRSVGGLWPNTGSLDSGDAGPSVTPGSGFGSAIAIDGTTVVIGAPTNGAVGVNTGSIVVFEDDGNSLVFDQACSASDATNEEQFGQTVSVSANRILVGAPFDGAVGSAYLLQRVTGNTFIEDAKFIPADGAPGDRFGASVAISNDTVAFGAPFNAEGGDWVGAAYTLIQAPSPVSLETICYGDGGDQAGCTDCPCGNNAPVGTVGGCLNSVGASAQLSVMGLASASSDTLRLEVSSAVPATFGVLQSGSNLLPANPAIPCPPGSGVFSALLDGLRCIGGGTLRHGTRATDAQGDIGVTNNAWGPPSGPAGGLVLQGGFIIGQTRFFQVTYREDVLAGCNTGLNTTNAAAATVAP